MESAIEQPEQAVVSYHLRTPGLIRTVYAGLLISEMVTISVVILLSVYFLYLLKRTVFFHYNLKILFVSYNIFAISTCVTRNIWLICELAYVSVHTMEIVMIVKNIFHISMSGHLWVISTERVMATRNSHNYEDSLNPIFLVVAVVFTILNGILETYAKYEYTYGRELTAAIVVVFTVISLIMMLYVYYKNKRLISAFQWAANRSHSYQIRENIKTSRTLNKCLVVGAVGLLFGSLCLVVFSTSKKTTNDWATIFWGFGFDITSAITTLIVPLILLFSEESDLSRRAYSYLGCLRYALSKKGHPPSIKDCHGRRITLTVDV